MDEAAKKQALRMVPYGLYLVGVREARVAEAAKDLNAFVGSWATQISFKPPMLAIGVKRESRSNAMIRASNVFALSILGSGQKDLGARFFRDLVFDAEGSVSGVRYEIDPVTGCPVFPDLPASVGCEVVHAFDGENDHTLFVGRVVSARFTGPPRPLTHDETGWIYAG